MKNLRTGTAKFDTIRAKDANGLHLQDDGGNGLFIKDGGNVGIGTTSPIHDLHLHSATTGVGPIIQLSNDTGDCRLFFGTDSTTGSANAAGQIRYNVTDDHLTFYSNLNERMRIDSTGNVGIGTTNPGSLLHIVPKNNEDANGDPTNESYFKVFDNATSGLAQGRNGGVVVIDANYYSSSSAILSVNGRGDNKLTIKANGNVGIGTTNPDFNLSVVSNTNPAKIGIYGYGSFSDGAVAAQLLFLGKDSNELPRNLAYIQVREHAHGLGTGSMEFFTRISGNENARMTIASNGNVGIGTTIPAQKLDVHGNIAVSGSTVHTSDDRVKHNEQPIVGALETLSKITPKKYIKTVEMYDANHDFELDADGNPVDSNGQPVEHRIEAGVIAQQVLTVDELAFAVSPEGVDEDGTVTSPHGLDYNSLFTYAIAAIQEQQQLIDDLKSQNESLAARISALES